MVIAKRTTIGITDLKNLFQIIKNKYAVDYSNYALSSLKRRIEEFLYNFHIINFDEFLHKIEKDPGFFRLFLQAQTIETTEMFRDPEFWITFTESVLSKFKKSGEIQVLFPDCDTGEEIYTFQIISYSIGLQSKTHILATTFNEDNINHLKEGIQTPKKMELNQANFERFQAGGNLENYFLKTSDFCLKEEFRNSIGVVQHNIVSQNFTGNFDIIVFRNRMLYYNPQLKIEALKKLDAILKPGGYIAVGIKESIDYPLWEHDYNIISDTERIYKKKAV
jgi:chemotaxis protein methyltransferase CheR